MKEMMHNAGWDRWRGRKREQGIDGKKSWVEGEKK